MATLAVLGVHGWAVAIAASLLGDPQPRHEGRLTPNPFAHFDLVGGFGLLLFGLGWVRPLPIDATELRWPRGGLLVLVVAGTLAVGTLGVLAYSLRTLAVAALSGGAGPAVASALDTTARLGFSFVLFNLLPLPPLTGRYTAYAALPRHTSRRLERFVTHAGVAMAVLIVTGVATTVLLPLIRSVSHRLLGLL